VLRYLLVRTKIGNENNLVFENKGHNKTDRTRFWVIFSLNALAETVAIP
jgi:NADH:ubiquinone oxidoreductase subunit